MLSSLLIDRLVCPQTKQKVRLAHSDEVCALNQKIRSGAFTSQAGKIRRRELEGALIRQDQKVAYPICKGIPVMLEEESFFGEAPL